ncbi:Hypothetical protein NTJ_13884 [Nesidiocoris tenuis]|uniref:Uncharacterized protein n=1 Tax=Nesidiocoris tenuis TaxID=355587 RepID=A0ABN7B9K2_9HEMI|nr:Hypothetical protein NTJ_13884 [Nesidiocoris tenuis]
MQDARKSGAGSAENEGSAYSVSPRNTGIKSSRLVSKASIHDPGLRPRDAIIIIVEMLLSYSWLTIRSRQVLADR